MAVGDYYTVSFKDAIETFTKRVSHEDLPTIDIDQVVWQVLEIFSQVQPLVALQRLVNQMLKDDWLYSKVEFVYMTVEDSQKEQLRLNQYLRSCIFELAYNLHEELTKLGMLRLGTERYRVPLQPHNHDSYTLRQVR